MLILQACVFGTHRFDFSEKVVFVRLCMRLVLASQSTRLAPGAGSWSLSMALCGRRVSQIFSRPKQAHHEKWEFRGHSDITVDLISLTLARARLHSVQARTETWPAALRRRCCPSPLPLPLLLPPVPPLEVLGVPSPPLVLNVDEADEFSYCVDGARFRYSAMAMSQ